MHRKNLASFDWDDKKKLQVIDNQRRYIFVQFDFIDNDRPRNAVFTVWETPADLEVLEMHYRFLFIQWWDNFRMDSIQGRFAGV